MLVLCISWKNFEKARDFLFDQFIKQWDFTKSLSKFLDFLHFVAYKYNLKIDDIVGDFNDFAKEEESKLKENSTEDDYKNFLDKKEDELNAQFQCENAFQTSTRGLKVRGVYPSQEEAEMRCKNWEK